MFQQNDDNESSDEFVPPPRNSIQEPEVFVSMPMDYEQPGVLQEEKYNNIEFENGIHSFIGNIILEVY